MRSASLKIHLVVKVKRPALFAYTVYQLVCNKLCLERHNIVLISEVTAFF